MGTSSDIRAGSIIRFNGNICVVVDCEHRTPGNKRGFYQAKMRNLKTGKSVEYRFRSGESVDFVRVDEKMMQFLYRDGDHIVCMDTETYEQFSVPKELFGEGGRFLKEGMEVTVSFEEGNPILAEAPYFVELEVTYTERGFKGDTTSAPMKPATVETGVEVGVPLFVQQGDKVKIDTRTGEYVERVKK